MPDKSDPGLDPLVPAGRRPASKVGGNISPEREEPFGLRPTERRVVAQPHLLQWIDPTFDEAEPVLDEWLQLRERWPEMREEAA